MAKKRDTAVSVMVGICVGLVLATLLFVGSYNEIHVKNQFRNIDRWIDQSAHRQRDLEDRVKKLEAWVNPAPECHWEPVTPAC